MRCHLGIDIAKKTFDAVLLVGDTKRHKVFDNDEPGYEALLAWLDGHCEDLHACMEATGGYGDNLALFLHQHGLPVSVVNPVRIKAFAKSEMARTKTDKADAGVIARVCRALQPALRTPLSPRMREFRALVRRCAALKDMRVQELQRRDGAAASAWVAASLERTLAWLNDEIDAVSAAIAALIAQDEGLRHNHGLLVSIPGIGAQAAAVLLAEIPDFRAFSHNKQITAFAGLSPQQHVSGSSVRGRDSLCKLGNARIRSILYLCALSARRHNPVVKVFADRLKQAGKLPKVILAAVARKLLVIAYGVMKTQHPFNPGTPS